MKPTLANKDKFFIDLAKCSEEEIKSLPQILKNAGEKYTPGFIVNMSPSDIVHFNVLYSKWALSETKVTGKTELTYSEFVGMFEETDDNNGWIKIEGEADLPKEKYGSYHVFTKDDVYSDEPKNQGIEEFYNSPDKADWWIKNVLYYQPIIKPLPPKF